jgi:putative transposase
MARAVAEDVSCGLHRVERLIRLHAFKARLRWRRLAPDLGERRSSAVARDVLDAASQRPNRKWIANFMPGL